MKGYICILLIMCTLKGYSQCLCSANPTGGSVNLLVLEKNTLRAITYYRHFLSNSFYKGSKPIKIGLVDKEYYDYMGSVFGFGITNTLTTEVELGYYLNKSRKFTSPEYIQQGNGFSNPTILLKYNLVNRKDKRLYLSSSIGFNFPLYSEFKEDNGSILDYNLQPTNFSYGLVLQSILVKEDYINEIRYFFTNRINYFFKNSDSYREGGIIATSFFISKHFRFKLFNGDITGIIQLRNELRGKSENKFDSDCGSESAQFFISPQVNYTIKEKWNISFLFDYPVYQYFKGIQMGNKFAFNIIASRDFSLGQP